MCVRACVNICKYTFVACTDEWACVYVSKYTERFHNGIYALTLQTLSAHSAYI